MQTKVICITDAEPRLTKDKPYRVLHNYLDKEYLIENDRYWKTYYPKEYFRELPHPL